MASGIRPRHTRSNQMKEVRKEDLSNVQGGSEQAGTLVDTLPYQGPAPTAMTISDGPLLPPALPQKQVES